MSRRRVVDRRAACPRFAAKEAATKVLRSVDGISYQSIEVSLDEFGAPELVLHGSALQRAEALGFARDQREHEPRG